MADRSGLILLKAHALLQREGTGFSLRELERSVDIGSSGLRRHVRNKEALIKEFAFQRISVVEGVFAAWSADNEIALRLEKWCFLLPESMLVIRGLAEMIAEAMLSVGSELHAVAKAIGDATEPVAAAAAARDLGRLRPDVDKTDVVLAVLAASTTADRLRVGRADETFALRLSTAWRMLSIALRGLGTIEFDRPIDPY